MHIAESARRHLVPDEDIRTALRLPLRLVHQGEDRVLVIGPDHSGQLLEVVVLDPDGEPVVIHAMPLRRKFYGYL